MFKNWWKNLKCFIEPSQTSSIPPIKGNGTIYSDNADKANLLNNYFTERSSLGDSNATLAVDLDLSDFTLNSISVTAKEVEAKLKSLQIGKAAGADAINNKMFKELAQQLSFPLCDLFNASLTKGKNQVYVSKLMSLEKDPSDSTNYRPISLLSTVGKVLGNIVQKYVFNFLGDHIVLTTLQSGVIPRR